MAVDAVLARHPRVSIAIVAAHGAVISLYLAARTGGEPFALWQRLGLPPFAVVALPEGRLAEVVERV